MQRRGLLFQLPAWLAAPSVARSQGGAKLLVMLTSFARSRAGDGEVQLKQELARLGWRLGENLRLEVRYAEGQTERLDALARELVALQPTAALAVDFRSVRALMRQSRTLPMVVAFAGDPVATGLADSLRRPGGQVTGLSLQYADIRPKTYELARQVAPTARRLAGLFDRRTIPDAQFEAMMDVPRRLAQQAGLEYVPLPVREAGEIEAALRSLTPAREFVLGVNIDELMFSNFPSTAALARTLRLPSWSQHQYYAADGGLFSYGPDLTAIWYRAVQMTDQVLRGQAPGEIPFEQPTRINFTLNRATANSIGLALSKELLLRADAVIG